MHDDDSIGVDLVGRSYDISIVSHQLAHCAKVFEHWWFTRDGMSSSFCSIRPPSGSVWVEERRNVAKPFALIVTDSNVAPTHAAAVQRSLVGDGYHTRDRCRPQASNVCRVRAVPRQDARHGCGSGAGSHVASGHESGHRRGCAGFVSKESRVA